MLGLEQHKKREEEEEEDKKNKNKIKCLFVCLVSYVEILCLISRARKSGLSCQGCSSRGCI